MDQQESWTLRRAVYTSVAVLALALGFIGIFLPVMPTVPFVLVSAWAASKGSPRIHKWLYSHSHIGPLLIAWDTHGAVPRRAKWLACIAMTSSWIMLFWLGFGWVVLAVLAVIFIAVAAFLISRPDS